MWGHLLPALKESDGELCGRQGGNEGGEEGEERREEAAGASVSIGAGRYCCLAVQWVMEWDDSTAQQVGGMGHVVGTAFSSIGCFSAQQ